MRTLGILHLLVGMAAGCGEGTGQAGPPRQVGPPPPPAPAPRPPGEAHVAVEIRVVDEKPVPTFITVTGALAANRTAQVASDATGRVIQTFVERGSVVATGAPLVELDARGAALSAAEARAQVQALRIQSRRARRECRRARRLYSERVINQAELDRASAECQGAEAQAKAALARQSLAANLLGDAVIRAPFAGVVDQRVVDVGEFVHTGSPVASVVDIETLRLALTVPEAEVGHVARGQNVEFDVAAFPDASPFRATVKYLGAAMRSPGRDLVVEAVVDNASGQLRPGMFAVARLETGAAPMPTVPAAAVRRDRETARVFVVRHGRAEEKLVQVGRALDAELAIVSGLKKGDKVVARLTDEVRDGVKVSD